jgi:hypothetical protein
VLERFCGGLIGNSTDTPEDVETLHAFARLVREHLGIPLPVFGSLHNQRADPQSIVSRQPLDRAAWGRRQRARAFHSHGGVPDE